ncbi:MAG: ATP-binding protein [Candidatus Firestonebacteria bacterium]|nr:ATP-binding protein [Candidatus Firestonebacteria bacterium]
MVNQKETKIGKFLFDSLTLGMYENPLCIFREYIQNSADAIDKAVSLKYIEREKGEIIINIDPQLKNIKIEDNGCGIGKSEASKILLSIGDSPKSGFRERGFRGIGRLGGMAYCDEIVFQTKIRRENIITINKWDCKKIKLMLDPHNRQYKDASLEDVISECTTIEQVETNSKIEDGFYRVEMKNVNCTNNIILDVKEIMKYISAVAPVPFNYSLFPFGKEIDEKFKKEIPSYNTFKILVNSVEIFKPYKTTIQIGKSKDDKITDIIEFEILDDDGKVIAKGWRGEREKLNAQITKSENIDGIRVRAGNILLGDEELLDKIYKEDRFNAWFVGEIHSIEPNLIPNSRRDDFEDNAMREMFYNSIEKILGIPLSNLVREKSKERSNTKVIKKVEEQILIIKDTSKKGFVGNIHKNDTIKSLKDSKDELEQLVIKSNIDEDIKKSAENDLNKIDGLISSIKENNNDIVSKLSSKFSKKDIEVIENIF